MSAVSPRTAATAPAGTRHQRCCSTERQSRRAAQSPPRPYEPWPEACSEPPHQRQVSACARDSVRAAAPSLPPSFARTSGRRSAVLGRGRGAERAGLKHPQLRALRRSGPRARGLPRPRPVPGARVPRCRPVPCGTPAPGPRGKGPAGSAVLKAAWRGPTRAPRSAPLPARGAPRAPTSGRRGGAGRAAAWAVVGAARGAARGSPHAHGPARPGRPAAPQLPARTATSSHRARPRPAPPRLKGPHGDTRRGRC